MSAERCACLAANALDCRWLALLATKTAAQLRAWDAAPDRPCGCRCHPAPAWPRPDDSFFLEATL